MSSAIKIVYGFLLPQKMADKMYENLHDNEDNIEIYALSYCNKRVIGIEANIPFKSAQENFLEVKDIPDNIYVLLCTLAQHFDLDEESIKTYVFAESYYADSGIMDSW